MSRARDIYILIQKERDKLTERWRDNSVEQHPLKCERDKQCEELQVKIKETFPEDFPHSERSQNE